MQEKSTAYLPLKFDNSNIFPRKIIHIRPDVHLTVSAGTFSDKTERNSATTAPVFELSYNRRSILRGEVDRTPVELRPGRANLGFLGQASGHAEYVGGEEVLLYSLWVGPDAFDRFCESVCDNHSACFHSFQSGAYCFRSYMSDAREESVLHKLDTCFSERIGVCNRLLLESCLLELLSINLERLLCPGCGAQPLTRTDRARFDEAREILLRRLDDPPSLLELSRLLHMNDCKLKRGFKTCYGKTVYEFVREQRLETAYSLLERRGCNVSEAAFSVGYTNVSHFSEAFQKQFGILPSTLRRSKG